jgi:hypothetical protein
VLVSSSLHLASINPIVGGFVKTKGREKFCHGQGEYLRIPYFRYWLYSWGRFRGPTLALWILIAPIGTPVMGARLDSTFHITYSSMSGHASAELST